MRRLCEFVLLQVIICLLYLATGPIMAAESIQFYSQDDKVVGQFFPAKHEAIKTVLLLHGFPGNPEDVLGLGERLSEKGYNVLTFNYRGTYDSEGNYGLESSQQDITAAYSFLCREDIVKKYNIDTFNLLLGGYSFGGGMALTYAANSHHFSRVFAIAPNDHGQFARDVQDNKEYHDMFYSVFKSLQEPKGPVSFEGDDYFGELLENVDYYDLRLAAPQLTDIDLLLIYGIDDASVTMEGNGLPFYRSLSEAGASSLDIRILQDDHAFGDSREELAEAITRWLSESKNELLEFRINRAELAQKWFRGVYGSDPTVVNDLAAEDVIISYPIFQKLFGKPAFRGQKAAVNFAKGFSQRWKETEVTIHETLVQDNQVVLIWSFKGRHVGSASEYINPTNKMHQWGGITLIRFNDKGKIVAEIGEESEPGPYERIPTNNK